jgi:hypothetical protein
VRSRAINRQLRDVETLPDGEAQRLLGTRSLFDVDDAGPGDAK